jgi:hypothetical protein
MTITRDSDYKTDEDVYREDQQVSFFLFLIYRIEKSKYLNRSCREQLQKAKAKFH